MAARRYACACPSSSSSRMHRRSVWRAANSEACTGVASGELTNVGKRWVSRGFQMFPNMHGATRRYACAYLNAVDRCTLARRYACACPRAHGSPNATPVHAGRTVAIIDRSPSSRRVVAEWPSCVLEPRQCPSPPISSQQSAISNLLIVNSN